mgnify:CR=1 FL=1
MDFEDKIVLGTKESCYIKPHVVVMRVRGGGLGTGAWIAQIIGSHPQYRFERKFIRSKDDLSRSGRSGMRYWYLPEEGGVFEYRDLCVSSRDTESGFFQVADGLVRLLEREDVERMFPPIGSVDIPCERHLHLEKS